ncbi:hypothetical protein [Micromonospora sp. NBC_00617]|uniref:hypothetical protein n=1 Tax=Micromonospora sp. NBC_00617 TaxID=2903587 RepID=UPI0030DE4101
MTHTARHRMLAGTAAGLLAASLGVALSSTATAAPRPAATSACTISTLPYPADTYRAEANAIDPSGRFVAGTALRVGENDNQYLMLLWDGQRLTEVEAPGVSGFDPADINESGIVIGNGWENGSPRAWRYRDGRFVQLPSPPSVDVSVTAINKAGDIVGVGSDNASGEYVALRWPADRPGTVEVLDAPVNARPSGITPNGTIVGSAGEFANWTGWVRRPNGRIKPLAVPGGGSTEVYAAAGHWAVGRVSMVDAQADIVRWDLQDGSYTTLDQQVGLLDDVNAKGVVVGGDRVARGATSRVLPGGGERVGLGARSIADTGAIVGFRNDDRVTPVRWTGC